MRIHLPPPPSYHIKVRSRPSAGRWQGRFIFINGKKKRNWSTSAPIRQCPFYRTASKNGNWTPRGLREDYIRHCPLFLEWIDASRHSSLFWWIVNGVKGTLLCLTGTVIISFQVRKLNFLLLVHYIFCQMNPVSDRWRRDWVRERTAVLPIRPAPPCRPIRPRSIRLTAADLCLGRYRLRRRWLATRTSKISR